ncbi:MAG: hypothetical protein HQK88_05640 [Nitrospirae bacterium]|nr:hypothetical protein [Nitrospirota bacterium]MBF0534672.1 hypothetical protein [Nitrospirota bacterium]MBF0616284.1 hypothetical protein [Nitrospirota bacterium]
MDVTLSNEKIKELLKEVLIELIQTKREVLYEIILEAMEGVGMANAISNGRKNEFVEEDEVFLALDCSEYKI